MLKITLSMIVKNEEKYLRECLQSVKDVVDEIILIDTGSSDNTINIAKEFGALIFNYNWINDFSAARNYALSKSTGDWILYLDADERLSSKSLNEFKNVTAKNDLLGYRCKVINIDEINGKPKFMRYTRLFHNSPKIKFSGKIHEQIDYSLIGNGYKIFDTDIEIIHTGYNISKDELKKKASRNLQILKDEFENNKSSYNAYQLANTYSILEEHEKAYQYYHIAIHSNKFSVEKNDLNNEHKALSYLNLSSYEYKNHNLTEAIEFLNKGLKNDQTSPLLNLLASEIYFRINKVDDSIKYCRKALYENKKILAGKNKSALTVGIKNELILSKGIYYSVLSSNKIELGYFLDELQKEDINFSMIVRKLIENKKFVESEAIEISKIISNDSLDMFLELFEKYKEKESALNVLIANYNSFKENSKFLKTLGLLYLENNQHDKAVELFEQSLSLKEKDPASVFYLISIYLQQSQLEKIPDLLIMAENEFENIPEFVSKFEILKQKLSTIFDNQFQKI